jgi:acyl-CoA synthetase (AMP-forming)/AMP-acid ligase II
VPVPDSEFGHRPVAFLSPPVTDPNAISASLEARLPRYKIPIAYLPWPDGCGLKPNRKALRELASP